MKRFGILCACGLLAGCGGGSIAPTTDPEAIKKEQESLRGALPGGSGKPVGAADDPIKREQERLRRGP